MVENTPKLTLEDLLKPGFNLQNPATPAAEASEANGVTSATTFDKSRQFSLDELANEPLEKINQKIEGSEAPVKAAEPVVQPKNVDTDKIDAAATSTLKTDREVKPAKVEVLHAKKIVLAGDRLLGPKTNRESIQIYEPGRVQYLLDKDWKKRGYREDTPLDFVVPETEQAGLHFDISQECANQLLRDFRDSQNPGNKSFWKNEIAGIAEVVYDSQKGYQVARFRIESVGNSGYVSSKVSNKPGETAFHSHITQGSEDTSAYFGGIDYGDVDGLMGLPAWVDPRDGKDFDGTKRLMILLSTFEREKGLKYQKGVSVHMFMHDSTRMMRADSGKTNGHNQKIYQLVPPYGLARLGVTRNIVLEQKTIEVMEDKKKSH